MAEQSKTRVISLEYPPSNPFICHLWLISIISVDLWLHINYPCCYFTSTERITQLTAGGIEYILPSKPLLRKISSKLHKLYLQKFFNPGSVHDEYMRLNQRDKKFEFHRPRGWMENNMTPFYCGLKELSKEKLDFQPRWEKTDCPVSLAEVEEILSFAPQTVSIPLFSFSIFSIIKFFFTKYPSRISMKDSYQSVTRSLRKILFLSLE